MLLIEIENNPKQAYIAMERYVNNGSPSKLDKIHQTSFTTRPDGGSEYFYLYSGNIKNEITFQDFGEHDLPIKCREMLLHPDMKTSAMITKTCQDINRNAFRVSPMSGSRTVLLLDDFNGFVKLSYANRIGRIRRPMTYNHAISSVEITRILENKVNDNSLPNDFYFFREPFARVAHYMTPKKNIQRFSGFTFRSSIPYPENNKIRYIIPFFSLFAVDTRNENTKKEPSLLTQLIAIHDKTPQNYLFENILEPVVRNYFELIVNCALELECHSQNTLLALDKDWNTCGIVIRDLESTDKDISLANELGLDISFESFPYKCLLREQYNYQIMHSFMYDFKLGEYLLSPCIYDVANSYKINTIEMENKIKALVKPYLERLPSDFFPEKVWYDYENKVFKSGIKRPYRKNSNIKYR